jgi:hypothetical protein
MKLMEPPLREERNPSSYCLNPSLMVRIESTEHVRSESTANIPCFAAFPPRPKRRE